MAQIWQDSWNATGLGEGSLSDYQQRLASQGVAWSIHVAIMEGAIEGFLAFQRPDWVRQLFVSPSHQGRGLGKALLRLAKLEMPDGFWLRTDAANVTARHFYEGAGLALRDLGVHPVHGQQVATYIWPCPD
ncbi:Putative acetyltransferase (fragment) [Methylocella tundrae]|uniref:Acetyltransferase n=1 Tax=Methylocella tundrae TaxID=227605 RepID=A0A4U8Z3W5_METTU